MSSPTLSEVERLLSVKNQRIEELFNSGMLREGVQEFYTTDVRYLDTGFRLLRGHDQVVAFLEQIRAQFGEVHLEPVETVGDPAGRRTVLQFVNVRLQPVAGGEVSYAHYVASFRPVGDDWLCEMEAPVFGSMSTGDRA